MVTPRDQSQRDNASEPFRAKRIVIMGLGRFGGGAGVARWLVDSGADVLITDAAPLESIQGSIRSLDDLHATGRLEIRAGAHEITMLDGADMLVVNPGVPQPWNNAFIREAQSRNIQRTTEIEIAYTQLDPSRTIAITGAAGKSTTSAMTHAILNASGHHALLGGNIGGSLLSKLDDIRNDSFVVLELSSAMIYWLWGREENSADATAVPCAPAVACLTNYSPNHIDWHAKESHYKASKKKLIEILPPSSTAILHESIEQWGDATQAMIQVVHDQEAVHDCAVPGHHNAINASMAVQAAIAITKGRSSESARFAADVRKFTGLPHRLNLCHQTNELSFYNDSKSTIPQATLLAIESIAAHSPKRTIHLICGGYDKGNDMSEIGASAQGLAGIYTIGATAQAVAQACASNAFVCNTLTLAFQRAIENAKPGDTILLSPGCASWDQYENYEQRGDHFKQLAKGLRDTKPC